MTGGALMAATLRAGNGGKSPAGAEPWEMEQRAQPRSCFRSTCSLPIDVCAGSNIINMHQERRNKGEVGLDGGSFKVPRAPEILQL